MKSRDFCYWLQGFFELKGGPGPITKAQAETIQKHLALVFIHDIDPQAGGPEVQSTLNEIHSGNATDGGALPGSHGPGYRC